MVALLSQCFNSNSNSASNDKDTNIVNNNNSSNITIPENSPLKNNNNNSVNVPTGNIDTGPSILEQQFKELKDYSRHLEKEVEEYKKYIEDRFNDIKNQQFHVIEGFENNSNSKDMNDIIVYLMTCIFVLLLVDYIFKMGKSSY